VGYCCFVYSTIRPGVRIHTKLVIHENNHLDTISAEGKYFKNQQQKKKKQKRKRNKQRSNSRKMYKSVILGASTVCGGVESVQVMSALSMKHNDKFYEIQGVPDWVGVEAKRDDPNYFKADLKNFKTEQVEAYRKFFNILLRKAYHMDTQEQDDEATPLHDGFSDAMNSPDNFNRVVSLAQWVLMMLDNGSTKVKVRTLRRQFETPNLKRLIQKFVKEKAFNPQHKSGKIVILLNMLLKEPLNSEEQAAAVQKVQHGDYHVLLHSESSAKNSEQALSPNTSSSATANIEQPSIWHEKAREREGGLGPCDESTRSKDEIDSDDDEWFQVDRDVEAIEYDIYNSRSSCDIM